MEVNICNKMIDARMMSASAFRFLKIFSGGICVESSICRFVEFNKPAWRPHMEAEAVNCAEGRGFEFRWNSFVNWKFENIG